MIEKRIRKLLEAGIYDDTRTVDLMDRFEGFGKDTAYVQLVLRNIVCINIEGDYEYLSLVVERSKDYRYVGNITFTELKQGQTRDLYSFLRKNNGNSCCSNCTYNIAGVACTYGIYGLLTNWKTVISE